MVAPPEDVFNDGVRRPIVFGSNVFDGVAGLKIDPHFAAFVGFDTGRRHGVAFAVVVAPPGRVSEDYRRVFVRPSVDNGLRARRPAHIPPDTIAFLRGKPVFDLVRLAVRHERPDLRRVAVGFVDLPEPNDRFGFFPIERRRPDQAIDPAFVVVG
jgi:hypothetical protein